MATTAKKLDVEAGPQPNHAVAGAGVAIGRLERFSYDDAVVRWFMMASVFWGIVGMLVGVLAALQLADPRFNLGLEWVSFGRIRPA